MTSTWKKPISRRQMLAGSGLAVGAGVTAALVGCGDDDDDEAPAPAATEAPAEATEAPAEATEAPAEATEAAAAATEAPAEEATEAATPAPTEAAQTGPKYGGVLRLAVQGDLLLSNGAPYTRAQGIPLLIFETLIQYEDSPSPTLVLAESYDVSDDFSEVTIKLKENAVFHDGSPVTPEDVFFGIDAIVNPEQYGFSFRGQLKAFASRVVDMVTVDERTMVFKFDATLTNINDFFAQFPVTKKSTYAQLQTGENIQGTGPYKMGSWTPGVGYELEPSTNWHDDRGPYLDKIKVIQFADAEAVGRAYEADDIDIASGVSPLFAKAHEDDVEIAAKWGIIYVGLNVTNPLFEDKRVRQALFFAIDRQRIIDELMEGLVELTTQPWDPGSPAFDPSLEQPFYEPERSKALLAEAGFSQTEPITFDHYANHPTVGAQLASLVKDNFAAVGVDIELVGHQIPDMNKKLFERDFDAGWFLLTGFSPFSPVTVITQPLPFQDNNPSKYTNPVFLDIREKLRTLDPFSEEAKVQYDRFNELFHDDPWLLPCAPTRGLSVVKPRVQDYRNYIAPLTYYGHIWLDDDA